jgi:putative hydrolases of HD superfamily
MKTLVNFLFEAGFLSKLKRSQRKNNQKSVAEHTFRVAVIGYVLAQKRKADAAKTVLLCLFHDLPETRVNDLDLVNRPYQQINEKKALAEMIGQQGELQEIQSFFNEYTQQKTTEAQLTHDADILEELLTEKEQLDQGDPRAKDWMKFTTKRLKTMLAKKLAQEIIKTASDQWWYDIIRKTYS